MVKKNDHVYIIRSECNDVSALSKSISVIHIDQNYGNRYVLNNADRVRNYADRYAVIAVVRTEYTWIYGKPRKLSGYSVRENDKRSRNSQIVCMLMI